jgi:hypothetical protein
VRRGSVVLLGSLREKGNATGFERLAWLEILYSDIDVVVPLPMRDDYDQSESQMAQVMIIIVAMYKPRV